MNISSAPLLGLVSSKFSQHILTADWFPLDLIPDVDGVTRSGPPIGSTHSFEVLVVRQGEYLLKIPWYKNEPHPAILMMKIGETETSFELVVLANSPDDMGILPGPAYGPGDIPRLIQRVENIMNCI